MESKPKQVTPGVNGGRIPCADKRDDDKRREEEAVKELEALAFRFMSKGKVKR